jgi:uncharacterized protein YqeY
LADELKTAMKACDAVRVGVIRMARSALWNAEIEARASLDSDEQVIAILSREANLRREAIEEFQRGGRQDLVQKEQAELDILEQYLPAALSEAEVRELAAAAMGEVGATTPADLGKVMQVLMPNIRGRADGKQANQIVRDLLVGSAAGAGA